jgi:hypothetical protein
MSWVVVFLLVGFWVLGLLNGYSFGSTASFQGLAFPSFGYPAEI